MVIPNGNPFLMESVALLLIIMGVESSVAVALFIGITVNVPVASEIISAGAVIIGGVVSAGMYAS